MQRIEPPSLRTSHIGEKLAMDVATDICHVTHVIKRPSSSKVTERSKQKQFDRRHVFVLPVPFFGVLPPVKQSIALVGRYDVEKASQTMHMATENFA
jgi:hypothetical protein